MGPGRRTTGTSPKGHLWSVRKLRRNRARTQQTAKPKKNLRCFTGCGGHADGTVFSLAKPICSPCFEEFVLFCGFGDRSIFIVMTWPQVIEKFLERKKNGRRIKSAYAGQFAVGIVPSNGSKGLRRNNPRLHVQGVPNGDPEDRGTDGSRGSSEQNEDAQMLESGETGLRDGTEVTGGEPTS
jgi:hypothetical protein